MIRYDINVQGLTELDKAFRRAPELTKSKINVAMNKSLVRLQATAKELAPVDTGNLRGSIQLFPVTWNGSTATGSVGTATHYACVFGANTRVQTSEGLKGISTIKVGDYVLTQAGDYREVIATHAFPALEKPDLIDVEVEYRKGSTHKLTLTLDHKVLVHRDGRNKWIQAGDLRMTDLMYRRIKKAHNKGAGRTTNCIWCNQPTKMWRIKGKVRMYCSNKCKFEHWNAGANPHNGMKRSAETGAKISAFLKKRFIDFPEMHPSRLSAKRGRRSQYEQAIFDWLTLRGVTFEEQKLINGSYVDFYLPESKTCLEADGSYWHRDQRIDILRDNRVINSELVNTIVHLHFFDERHTPQLDLNPSPGIYYVPCNPGTHSFTDPTEFRTGHVVGLRKWTYGAKRNRRASHQAYLYDLTVDGVHSFVANGLLISNSHQEAGTGIYGPTGQPIRPKTKKVLAWKKGGTWHFAKEVKGVRPKWYMRTSLQRNEAAVNSYFATAVDELTQHLAGGVR